MTELREQHRAVTQGDARRADLVATLRIECAAAAAVQPVAQVPVCASPDRLGGSGSPVGRGQVRVRGLAVFVGGRDPQAAVVQHQRRFEEP